MMVTAFASNATVPGSIPRTTSDSSRIALASELERRNEIRNNQNQK